jgi:hypothetical protein
MPRNEEKPMQDQELRGIVFEKAAGELRGFIFPDGAMLINR